MINLIQSDQLKNIYDLCNEEWVNYSFIKYLYERKYSNFGQHLALLIDCGLIILNEGKLGTMALVTSNPENKFNPELFFNPPNYTNFHSKLYRITSLIKNSQLAVTPRQYNSEFEAISFLVGFNIIKRLSDEPLRYSIDVKYLNLLINFHPNKRRSLYCNDKDKKNKGLKAEHFTMEFEKNRLKREPELLDKLVHISLKDDAAGYDILSSTINNSLILNRYIEVKALDDNHGFYFSINQKKFAQKMGDLYYLYLVDLDENLVEIIQNPAKSIFVEADEWNIEIDKYYISKDSVSLYEKKPCLSG